MAGDGRMYDVVVLKRIIHYFMMCLVYFICIYALIIVEKLLYKQSFVHL